MLAEPLQIVAKIARILSDLGVDYVVGGSLASSLFGVPRATQDVDFAADLRLDHVDALTSALAGEFYADAGQIRDAVQRRGSFNVIHLGAPFKADVFIRKESAWSREEMARARIVSIDTPDGPVDVRFAGPEDTLLHKLVWYRRGHEVSDRQWGDILGVLKVQGDALDHSYLDHWAPLLDVMDLLARARKELRESP